MFLAFVEHAINGIFHKRNNSRRVASPDSVPPNLQKLCSPLFESPRTYDETTKKKGWAALARAPPGAVGGLTPDESNANWGLSLFPNKTPVHVSICASKLVMFFCLMTGALLLLS